MKVKKAFLFKTFRRKSSTAAFTILNSNASLKIFCPNLVLTIDLKRFLF